MSHGVYGHRLFPHVVLRNRCSISQLGEVPVVSLLDSNLDGQSTTHVYCHSSSASCCDPFFDHRFEGVFRGLSRVVDLSRLRSK